MSVVFDPATIVVPAGTVRDVYGTVSVSNNLDFGTYEESFCISCKPTQGQTGAAVQIETCGLPIKVNVVTEEQREAGKENMYIPPKPFPLIGKVLIGIGVLAVIGIVLISGCVEEKAKEWVEISVFCQCCCEPWGIDDNITSFFKEKGVGAYDVDIRSRGLVCEACNCPSYEIKEVLIDSRDKDKVLKILSDYGNISRCGSEDYNGDEQNENKTPKLRYRVSECNESWKNNTNKT